MTPERTHAVIRSEHTQAAEETHESPRLEPGAFVVSCGGAQASSTEYALVRLGSTGTPGPLVVETVIFLT